MIGRRILTLHRSMIDTSSKSLNRDGEEGSAVDPLIWHQGSHPKVRKLDTRIIEEFATLRGPPGFSDCTWRTHDFGTLARDDVCRWPLWGRFEMLMRPSQVTRDR